jgi:hypothetical protein
VSDEQLGEINSLKAEVDRIAADSAVRPKFETAEAGALWGLYYALYYVTNAAEVFKHLPDSVLHAYLEVQKVARGKEIDDAA